MNPRIRRYVMQSGFYGVYRVGHISLDWPLITSLVERWRPETHTFHLPIGEMTVTLQDVAMILGLRIHGPPITGTCDIDWSLLRYELLGVDDVILQRYAHAFILALLGGALFADKTSTHVQLCYLPLLRDFTEISHYSWASAVLAYLYRELCRASLDSATKISGPITLLQERLHVGRPDFGRPPVPIVVPHVHDDVVDGLHDHLLPDEALPIDPLGHRASFTPVSYATRDTSTLLIDMELHLVDRRGRHQYDWVTFHAQYISLWATRSERIATAPLAITAMSFYDPYMQWYRCITRRLIAPILHRDHMRFHSTASATELLMGISNDLEETHRIAIDVLRVIGEDHRVHSTHKPSTSSGSSMRPPSLITPVRVPPIRESPLSPSDVSIPTHSPRPETTIPSTLTPVQPSISLDAPPPIAEFIAPPPVTKSIASPPVTESIAPLPFLQGTTHAARLHVRVPKGHRAPRVRRVLPPSVPSISTAHVDDVSQSIEMETFQIAQMDTTNMAIYRRCSQRKRKIPSCGTH
ncbi:Serine/threonine-protein phosphatase 7 long form-like [Vitis vinifera]|uniref:Serine/threonine-protein phosphatase 7 long form-like n=1 Tax=Vitis vinifera TaxID=29760 RepID=A0A438JHA5_VITVI|nr:Serine/threonine-protein phosphatase 7 long form-like [Vitis vinifera]